MNGPEYAGRSIVIEAVTPYEINDARTRVAAQPDRVDLLEALGIGNTIQILTTEDVA